MESAAPMQPDRIFGELLQQPDNLRAVLRDVVPDVVDQLRVEEMVSVRSKFRLPEGFGREADLLFEVPFQTTAGDVPFLICVAIEHQSTPDAMMALRTLTYATLYWNRERPVSSPLERLLPPILSIVFYTGTRPWNLPRAIAEILAESAVLHPLQPIWQPIYRDLSAHSADDLANAGDGDRAGGEGRIG